MAELKRQNIVDFEIWPCLIYPEVVRSISESHKMIVRDAKEKGLERCCIAEDDLMFPAEDGWQYFLKNEPDFYDIYSAANYISFERPTNKGVFKTKYVIGFHLYMVHSRYYDTFLNVDSKQHIDGAQKSENMYVVYPFAALQRPGYSANNRDAMGNSAMVNYNKMLKSEDIYQ